MSKNKTYRSGIEALEARIAPAAVAALPTIKQAELAYDANPFGDTHFVHAVTGTPILLKAGQVLTTGSSARSGNYLMFVQKGEALIFTTDLNNNGQVDYNEITGVAAGNGLRLISFVDIHGDIVTNLDADHSLSDSDNNASNNPVTGGDGRVLNNSTIEGITFRSLRLSDITDQNNDMVVDNSDLALRFSFTSYSLFGQIIAGKSFGVAGDPTSGLHIDDSGSVIQTQIYNDAGPNYFVPVKPTVGAIRTGTAASGEYFAFGYSHDVDTQGTLVNFIVPAGQVGGDISYVSAVSVYNFSGAYAGDGGTGARGGTLSNITINGDDTSGYHIVAGNGGRGTTGGAGGSILNFTDLGSITGNVELTTGNGGEGTNGLGGNGGSLGLGTTTVTSGGTSTVANLNVDAGVTINLGNGGNGFRGGGQGASLTNLVVLSPDDPGVIGDTVVGVTHDRAHDPATGLLIGNNTIGNSNSFDFDGDGFNDIVYTTSNPEQLMVAFGNGGNGIPSGPNGGIGGFDRPVQLDGPGHITAAAVGDLNGDGHPDVVVGSSRAGDFSGITVFLSKFETVNGVQHFLGFETPRISPLPSLNSGDPNGSHPFSFQYRNTTNPITSIAVGDFDGDGHTDIAVTASYVEEGTLPSGTGGGSSAAHIEQIVMILSPDIENGRPDGHFYADMGTKAANGQAAQSNLPFVSLGIGSNAKVLATAYSALQPFNNVTSRPYDVAVATTLPGSGTIGVVDGIIPFLTDQGSYLEILDISNKLNGPSELFDAIFDEVDTNRAAAGITPVIAKLRDFTILDLNQDGAADYVGLTDTPTSYLVGYQGFADGGGQDVLNNASGDNSGYLVLGTPKAIRASGPTSQGSMSTITILNQVNFFETYSYLPNSSFVVNPGLQFSPGAYIPFGPNVPAEAQAWDPVLVTNANGQPDVVFPYADFPFQGSGVHGIYLDDQKQVDLVDHSLTVNAGDGGNGSIGKGGNGGSLGSGTLKDTGTQLVGSIDITLQLVTLKSIDENVILRAGHGGDGFSTGGAGGRISGVVTRPNPASTVVAGSVELFAGDGGSGNSGAGGAGGSLSKNSLFLGDTLVAGNGGNGLIGGAGGSVLGNGLKLYSDTTDPFQQAFAGNGGDGVRKGGAGGSVTNFHGEFTITFFGEVGGALVYVGGNGGSGAAGAGGVGGDVVNVSPFTGGTGSTGANVLGGDIALVAGNGGDGTIGGRGGNVGSFVNQESQGTPGLINFISGNGGHGSISNGGAGGSVTNISVSSTGTHRSDAPVLSNYTYNHIIAGAGGSSAGAAGGSGGSVLNIITNASDGTFAVAAGDGGDGLFSGGIGGSVKTLSLSVGGLSGKGLIIAGAGGAAGAVLGDGTGSSTGIGGRIGIGGAGGSIVGFRQTGGIGSHFDLIAGNGGDSLNFGTVANPNGFKYVGKGGSISSVVVQGTLGNVDYTTPIKSYNDILGGESMGTFVQNILRTPTDAALIDDSQGNVGVTVGAAGRLKSVFVGYDSNHNAVFRSIAAFGAVNGDLISVRAKAVLAAVAGNVERIAAIHTVKDLLDINNPSHAPYVGTDKAPLPNPSLPDELQYKAPTDDFKLPDSTGKRVYPNAPLIDGGLIDGALVSGTAPKMTVGGHLVDLNFTTSDPNVGLSHRFVIS